MKNDFIELTRKKMISVVQVYVEGYFGEEVKSILNPRIGNLKEWTGSGFFVENNYKEGLIVTNAHVVKNAKTIEIMSMLTSEEKFGAELVGIVKNHEPDIAVIKIKDDELKKFKECAQIEIPSLRLRTLDEISRGTSLKAIGYPMGMSEPNITGGEITNFISGDRVASEKYVTDAAINPGNSGGPAIDEDGNVIGVNTSIFRDAENIGFITPSTFVSIILKNIFENNAICFTEIGGNFQKNSDIVSKNLGMTEANGIIVSSVENDGLLDKAGIIKEDVILGLNGKKIDRHGIFFSKGHFRRKNIFDVLKLIPIGQEISFSIRRGKKEKEVKVNTSSFPIQKTESKSIISERKFLDVWGMTVQVLSYEIIESFNIIDTQTFYDLLKRFDPGLERLIVTHIKKESSSYLQEWSIGEVLDTFNEEKINGMEHFLKMISSANGVAKIRTEFGTIGFFDCPIYEPKLQEPSMFLE